MRIPLFLSITLLAAGFAGCFAAPGATLEPGADPFTVSRVVRVTVDEENVERLSQIADDPTLIEQFRYDFLDPSLVIRVSKSADPALYTFTYVDRAGETLTKPLNLLTGAPGLAPGDTIVVPVHMFSGGVLKKLDGTVLADRTTSAPDWWRVAGWPSGMHMSPNSQLVYDLAIDVRQSFELTGVQLKDEPYRLDVLRASMGFENDATLSLTYGRDLQPVTAQTEHQARPLVVNVEGRLATPMELSFTGSNLTSGRAIDAGIEILPETALDYAFEGRMWWNESLHPVRFDLQSGSARMTVDAVAWLTGAPELEDSFSCASAPRSAQCRPDEIPYADLAEARTLTPDALDLDESWPTIDPAIERDLAAFLADDLAPGDEIAYSVTLRGQDLPGYEPDAGMPREIVVDAITRVLGEETVTVAAGTFETLKIDQMLTLRLATDPKRSADGTTFGALELDERLFETSTWLDKRDFTPVKMTMRAPFDVGRMVDEVLDAIDAETWMDAPIERTTSQNVQFSTTSTQTMELTKRVGDTRFAPWLMLGGLPLFFMAQEGLPYEALDAL